MSNVTEEQIQAWYNKTDSLLNRQMLLDTLEVFAYLIKPEDMYYDFLTEVRSMICPHCERNVGEKLIIDIQRKFSGMNISFPSLNEIRVYKYLIENPESINLSYTEFIRDLTKHGLNGDNYDIRTIVSNFTKVVKKNAEAIKRTRRTRDYKQQRGPTKRKHL